MHPRSQQSNAREEKRSKPWQNNRWKRHTREQHCTQTTDVLADKNEWRYSRYSCYRRNDVAYPNIHVGTQYVWRTTTTSCHRFVLLRPELPEGITSTSKTAFISCSTPFEIKQQPHQKQQQINPQVMTKSTANRHSFQMVSKVKVNEFVGGLCHGIASATSSKKKHHPKN